MAATPADVVVRPFAAADREAAIALLDSDPWRRLGYGRDDWTRLLATPLEGREGWQAILDRWGVDAVVLQTDPSGLSTRIARDPRWRLAYRDPLGVLYVRA